MQLTSKTTCGCPHVSLKLKRKLEYKQAYLHDTICPEKVITALHHLRNNNPLYGNIKINEDWIRGWQDADSDHTSIVMTLQWITLMILILIV